MQYLQLVGVRSRLARRIRNCVSKIHYWPVPRLRICTSSNPHGAYELPDQLDLATLRSTTSTIPELPIHILCIFGASRSTGLC
jgi:hypothetical protein